MKVELEAVPFDEQGVLPASWEDMKIMGVEDTGMFPKYMVVNIDGKKYLILKDEIKRLAKSL